MNQYILTIDIGTTSTKAYAFLQDGSIIGSFQKPYPTFYPQPSFAEQDADEIVSAVKESILAVKKELNHYSLLAISFSSAMHSFMALDAQGNPLTNLIIWADNRSQSQAVTLKASAAGTAIYNSGGTAIHPMAPVCKLLWLRHNQKAIFESASKFISIKEYVFFKLTGEFVIDYSIASATGLFDSRNLKWNQEALAICGITAHQLSQPCSPERKFALLETAAGNLGVSVDVPLIIGASDGCLANLGSHALDPGSMAITIGTSGAVRMTAIQFKADPLQRTFCYYLSHDKYIIGGASNNGAVLLTWFAQHIQNQQQTAEEFLNDAFSVPSTEGLIFLPYLMGERAPIYSAEARGAYIGISISHTQAHFKRALVEGICFAMKSIVNSVEEVVMPANQITVSGGFIQSSSWVQLLCDILGKPLFIDGTGDASSVGAAMLGFTTLGIDYSFTASLLIRYNPDEERTRYLIKEFKIFESLYGALKSEFPKLTTL